MNALTLAHLLADPSSAEPAIIDEAAAVTVSHRSLADQVERLAGELRGAGLQPGDPVVLVLPNGLELLVLCITLARAGLIAVPLDPASKLREIHGLVSGIGTRAVIGTSRDAAVAVIAAVLGVPMWTSSLELPGEVRLGGIRSLRRDAPAEPSPDDAALYLHTSGTTGSPKVVPLTHANVLHSVRHIVASFALTPVDRTLLVLPLFHGHGLIGAALSSLASGGTVIVAPRFSASRFWTSFRKHRATWYTAVPTIHQILLTRADADGTPVCAARFIRSCSSALSSSVRRELEARFGAPVIEAYGLTETSHQVAANPLPPHLRKTGSVGRGTGVELAILGNRGRMLPAHAAGEVIVRGASVMRGYLNNAAANCTAFMNGWFRTGDIGVLDDDGYLALTGRLKEMINRGGEKIWPAEIDAVLLAHPAVAEAAAFAVPDPKYGEAVDAAVVLKGDTDASRLRSYCGERLADFKVPRVIHIVSALPKTAVGKIERHALAASYAATDAILEK